MKCFLTVGKFSLQSKMLLTMKLTALLLLSFALNVSANGFGQDKISLRMKKTEISGVLRTIEKQTNYRFLYNDNLEDIREKVTISVREASLDEVLNLILEKTSLLYQKMDNNLVVIKEAPGIAIRVPDVVIRGKVTGEGGMAIAGASVQIKGTTTGTSTDNEGNFSITAPDANITLIISSVGYDSQEIALGGRTEINVSLVTSTKLMDQVVVIGYGTASKRDLTGSIVKVSGKDVADKPNTNPVASLQGKVSGLSVVNSGKPGQEPDIRIRGTVSTTQTKPLYVVDGIFNDNIDYLNPADIESMEILKDPSSLAIFGVRGANGVIAVTTKKGRVGQVTVNVNSSVGIKSIVDKISMVDAAGYKSLLTQQYANQGTAPYPHFDLYNGNTDWVDLITQDGFINVNNVSITSGTEKNKFYMGLGYTSEEGLIKHELLRKLTLTLNDELKVTRDIKLGFNFTGYKAKLPQLQSLFSATSAAPIVEPFNTTFNVYNEMPFGLQDAQVDNPLRVVEETKGQDLSNVYRIVGNVYTEVNFLKRFTFRAAFSGDLAFNENRHYTPQVFVYGAVNDTINVKNAVTKVSQRSNRFSKFQQDYNLTYKNQFGDHGLTVLAGFATNFNSYTETNGEVSQFTTGTATPIPNDKRFWYLDNFFADPSTRTILLEDNFLFGDPPFKNPLQWEQSTVSFLGRVLYNYKGKYLLNASFRRDGSSDISPSNKYQNFVAVGAAWEITKEGFMQDQETFDFLKLKGSWGVLGNQYTAIHYPFYPLLTPSGSAVFGPDGGALIPAYTPTFIADPNLKWETINSAEIGVEFAVLNRRLNAEVNYYNKLTKDLLTNYPSLQGQKPGITNAGEISNKGIELALTWSDQVSKDFSYTISGNLTTLNNKVKSTYNNIELFSGPTRTRAGDPIGSFYGYIVEGIYQNSADSASNPNNSYSPGDFKFRDVNGDKVITPDDRTVIGNPTPDVMYGFSLGANYKGFDFSIDFQGVGGNEIFRNWGNGAGYARLNYRSARLGAWHGAGTSNWEPILSDNRAVNRENSTYMIESGSYLRIRNAQIGYNFGTAALSKVHIKSLRVYISGQNLKTFKDNSGYTPEFGGSALQFGVDDGSYPVPAVYTFGINLNF